MSFTDKIFHFLSGKSSSPCGWDRRCTGVRTNGSFYCNEHTCRFLRHDGKRCDDQVCDIDEELCFDHGGCPTRVHIFKETIERFDEMIRRYDNSGK